MQNVYKAFLFRVFLFLEMADGFFLITVDKPSPGWTHVVLNYIGPDDGQGIQIYMDGVQTENDTTKTTVLYTLTLGDGKVVVGRRCTDRNQDYASVEIDELVFFNSNINMAQIQMLAS